MEKNKIVIKVTSLKNNNTKLTSLKNTMNGIKTGINSTNNHLEMSVKSRYNIANAMAQAVRDAEKIKTDLDLLYSTVNRCIGFYVDADDKVKKRALKISNWK